MYLEDLKERKINDMERVYKKLVRDMIPNIIETKGEVPVTRILTIEEYKRELEKKLKEEYDEVLSATGSDRIEELADMLEVIKYLAKVENSSLEEVMKVAEEKSLKRGAFEKRVFLEKVIEKEG